MGLNHTPLQCACTCIKEHSFSMVISVPFTSVKVFNMVLVLRHTKCYTLQIYVLFPLYTHISKCSASVNVCCVIRVIVNLFSTKPVQMRHHLELIVSKPHKTLHISSLCLQNMRTFCEVCPEFKTSVDPKFSCFLVCT